jgi:hypothetical protein
MVATLDLYMCGEVKSMTDTVPCASGTRNQPSLCTHAQALLVLELGMDLLASSLQPPTSSLSHWQRRVGGLAILQEEVSSQWTFPKL